MFLRSLHEKILEFLGDALDVLGFCKKTVANGGHPKELSQKLVVTLGSELSLTVRAPVDWVLQLTRTLAHNKQHAARGFLCFQNVNWWVDHFPPYA